MKSLLLSILIIISALLLIGSTCNAQSEESDRDWIDSLSVKYRMDFIESALLHDQATLDSMGTRISVLILNVGNKTFERTSNDDILKAIRQYHEERRAQQLRRHAYQEEMRLARTDFSSL